MAVAKFAQRGRSKLGLGRFSVVPVPLLAARPMLTRPGGPGWNTARSEPNCGRTLLRIRPGRRSTRRNRNAGCHAPAHQARCEAPATRAAPDHLNAWPWTCDKEQRPVHGTQAGAPRGLRSLIFGASTTKKQGPQQQEVRPPPMRPPGHASAFVLSSPITRQGTNQDSQTSTTPPGPAVASKEVSCLRPAIPHRHAPPREGAHIHWARCRASGHIVAVSSPRRVPQVRCQAKGGSTRCAMGPFSSALGLAAGSINGHLSLGPGLVHSRSWGAAFQTWLGRRNRSRKKDTWSKPRALSANLQANYQLSRFRAGHGTAPIIDTLRAQVRLSRPAHATKPVVQRANTNAEVVAAAHVSLRIVLR